ncbi:MAG TPA: LLM class flavin-dependent oxidoreductase [Actinomycetota bacterium]|nr:LLM class flavin-dependent oxidoreductase [Actinomycetota bacterium]
MDRLGCFFMTARSVSDLEARILTAERLGYDIAGLPQIAGRDAMTTLALIAPKTTTISLATGIVPIWTRTPITLAQEAGVLAEATNGRFMLGVGVGHRALVESWHGTPFRKPLTAMRDYLTILRGAFRDAQVSHTGEIYSASFGFMGFRPPPDVPLLVGALGPKMLQLAGEMADGVVLWLSSPQHIRDIVMPNLEIGAARAGRDVSSLDVFACLFAAPGPDRASARDAIRRQMFAYVQLPFYRDMLVASGFGEDLEAFDAGIVAQDLPMALAGLSDDMIDTIAATGDLDEIAQTLDAFRAAGCTTPGVGVVGGYEGYQGPEVALTAIRDAGARV